MKKTNFTFLRGHSNVGVVQPFPKAEYDRSVDPNNLQKVLLEIDQYFMQVSKDSLFWHLLTITFP